MRKTLTSAGALCGAVLCGGGLCAGALAAELPDIGSVLPDLTVPTLEHSQPGPGKRVYEQESEYAGTDVRHIVYLPRDWRRDKLYPVIVEYAGNGPYENKDGDVSTGEVEGSVMGYGLSGGEGFIWLALPFVNSQEKKNQAWWWGRRPPSTTPSELSGACASDTPRRRASPPRAVERARVVHHARAIR